jgi:O-antigen/teichoic acid export membrane protein
MWSTRFTAATSLGLTVEPEPKFVNIVPAFVRRRIEHRPNLLKIVDNIGWLFFDKVLRMGVGLLVMVWVARYLGPQQYGQLNFATAFVGLFGAVAGLGLQSILVRDIVRDPAFKEEILGTAAFLQLGGGVLAYGLILGTIYWLRPDDVLAKWLVAILGSMMLFKASEVAMYWFESQVLSKYTVWVQNGSFLVFAAVKLALIYGKAPLLAFAWATVAEAALFAVLLLAMLGMHGPGLRKLEVSLARAKTLLADSWPLLLSGLAIATYMKIDQIMLGQMMGDEAVGVYSAATRISEVWYFIPMMIVSSIFPSILAAKKQSDAIYQQRLQRLYDLMVLLSVSVALPMTFLAGPIVFLLYGPAYAEAGTVLAIHIWTSVFVFLGVASSQWFVAENRQILSFQRTLLGAVINIFLNYIFIPQYGVAGAAYATVLAQASVGLLYDIFQKETRPMFRMKIKSFNPLHLKKYRTTK